jgi:hypothetical protein
MRRCRWYCHDARRSSGLRPAPAQPSHLYGTTLNPIDAKEVEPKALDLMVPVFGPPAPMNRSPRWLRPRRRDIRSASTLASMIKLVGRPHEADSLATASAVQSCNAIEKRRLTRDDR